MTRAPRRAAAKAAPRFETPFREAADSAPAPVWMTDTSGNIEFVNRAMQDFAGLPADELMGDAWLTRLHPEDLPQVVRRRAEAWANGHAPYVFEARFKRADGERRLLEVNSRPRRTQAGEFAGYVGIAIDITERSHAEAARRQLIAIVESSSDAIISTDLSGVITTWNKGAERLYGYTAEEALGMSVDILIPSALPEELDIIRRVRNGERLEHYETVRRRKDGSLVDISLTVSAVCNESGAIVGVSKIARDISERKRVDDALSESERRYRELVNGLTDSIVWEGDPETLRFTFVSGAAERLLGYPAERWIEEPTFWFDHIHPDDREWAVEYCVQETKAGRDHEIEYRMIAADGRTVWIRDKAYLSTDALGRRTSRGIMMDITTARRHEDALRAREAELELIARMTPLALVRCDRNLVYRFINRAHAEQWGLQPEEMVGRRITDVMGEKAFAAFGPYVERVLAGETVEYEAEVAYPATGPRWRHVILTPDRDIDGKVVGFFASAVDITQRKRDEEHKKLLIDELNHRVRNTLAVVQSIAQQTLKGEAATDAARRAFEGRLLALAKAHGLLTRTSWESAALADIIEDAAHTNVPARRRVRVSGPDITLGPKPALAIAMALHELFTNAIKYGSLSSEEGWIEIAWSSMHADRPGFELSWSEHGGPPVAPPTRRGYGSLMIEQVLARDLQGEVTLEYNADGLRCRITAPCEIRHRS